MISINIQNKWQCYFFFGNNDLSLLTDCLIDIDCSKQQINKAIKQLQSINSGFTYTNYKFKTSVIGISDANSKWQWFNTLVHELKHVQSHICYYYDVDESGEEASYLI